jgi:ligand-binding sensor domain-containing protein/signal transduction histidine kinase
MTVPLQATPGLANGMTAMIMLCSHRAGACSIKAALNALGLLLLAAFLLPAQALPPSFHGVAPWAPSPPASQSVTYPTEPKAGATQPIKFERISLEEGLSQSSVYCILQDSRGFLWFGTEDGLNKYDGYTFTVYRNVPDDPTSLSKNIIQAMAEDQDGMLWIGTDGGGLNRFDRNTGQFLRYRASAGPSRLSSDYVRALHLDKEGMLWIATNGGGLNRFDRSTERFEHYQHNPADPDSLSSDVVLALYEDREGMLWVGTDGGGLNRFDRATGKFVRHTRDPGNPYSLSSNTVWAIYEDREGVLWVGTNGGGLNCFDRANERFAHYRHDPGDPYSLSDNSVSSIYQDEEGILWIGTYGGGLDLFEPENASEASQGRFVRYQNDLNDAHSLSHDFVWSIFEDQMGVLWIGTQGGGINKSSRLAKPFVHYWARPNDENSLSNNVVWAIYEDGEGVLWVGTNGGGLDRFDRSTDRVTHYQHAPNDPHSLSNDVVRVIYEDRAGMFWIGMDDGKVDQFDRATGQFAYYQLGTDDPVLAIHEDQQGNLWTGTSGSGLYWLDRTADHFVYYGERFCSRNCLSSEYVRDIHEDPEGVLWIATMGGGLDRFEPAQKRFTYFLEDRADPSSLSSNTILSIHQDREGQLWIGTHGGGLNRFNSETGTFTRYREQDGLANDVVYGILEDSQGRLWLSTNRGLSRFDPQTETFRNYDASDGLQSNEFNGGAYFQSQGGEMFFGGINGFNAFFPEQVKENLQTPPVVVTAFRKFNQTVRTDLATDEQIQLSYRDNFLSFEFAALDYTAPEQNQYAYQMEGLDRDWVYVGTRRHVDYPNLSPGDYLFRVKGSNSDGIWNEEGTRIQITITPPFWGTWWFRAGLLLLLVGIVIGAHQLRVRSIEARSRELAVLVGERTAELQREIEQRLQAEEALRHSETERAVLEAIAAERSRLARDLHDAVSQTLFSAGLIAEALPQSWERDRQEGQQLLRELRQLTKGALAEMRTLLMELRPAALVEADLGDLLRQLAEAAAAREGLPIDVTVEGHGTLPSDVHIALYRIAQEALNNVIKHARASEASVDLRFTQLPPAPSQQVGAKLNRLQQIGVELSVRDNGRGFEPDAIPPERLGLSIMRERAESVGAQLTVESKVARGTKVTVVWHDGR